ncbi:Ger(x)C family spore germination protein [Bacillus sp. FJAT-52991]|uniref:Ger(X)C family spore germination protein n=1 Tax=Bacillus kandeliae TaxID=3129297 RepID=A0ABZ2N8W8_9BACI
MKNYVKQILLYTAFLMTPLLLAGCWDANEPEQMLYIQGVGVDYKKDEFVVYLQIINPGLLAKSESTGGVSEAKVVVGRGTGKTVNEAIFDIYRSSQRRLFWGHINFFIFTDKALENDALKALMDLFDRYRETRYGSWLFVTKEPLFDIMTTLPPSKSSTVFAKLSDPESSYKQRSLIKPIDMRELFISLNEPPHEAVIPFVKLAKDTWKSDEGKNPAVQIDGIASITRKTLKGIMSYKKVPGLQWVNEDLKRNEISLTGEYSDISLLVEKVKIKKKPIVKGTDVSFALSIDATVLLREITSKKNLKKIEQSAEKVFKDEIVQTFNQGLKMDTDLFRLSEALYRKDVHTWKKIEKNGKIPLTSDTLNELSVNVKVKMTRGERQRKRPTL